MNDTPLTDALIAQSRLPKVYLSGQAYLDMRDLARRLEAELATLDKERKVALAKVSRDGLRIAELEAVEERLLAELATVKATCEDYRLQACKPDDCRVKADRDSLRKQWKTLACPECAMLSSLRERHGALQERYEKVYAELDTMKAGLAQHQEDWQRLVRERDDYAERWHNLAVAAPSKAERKLAVAVEAMKSLRPALFAVSALEKIDAIEKGEA